MDFKLAALLVLALSLVPLAAASNATFVEIMNVSSNWSVFQYDFSRGNLAFLSNGTNGTSFANMTFNSGCLIAGEWCDGSDNNVRMKNNSAAATYLVPSTSPKDAMLGYIVQAPGIYSFNGNITLTNAGGSVIATFYRQKAVNLIDNRFLQIINNYTLLNNQSYDVNVTAAFETGDMFIIGVNAITDSNNDNLWLYNFSLYNATNPPAFFKAKSPSGALIKNWTLNVSNSTTSFTESTNDYSLNLSDADLPRGTSTFTYSAGGYVPKSVSFNVNDSSLFNEVFTFAEQALLNVSVYDEKTLQSIKFDLMLNNGTNVTSFTGLTNLSVGKNGVPLGYVTVTIRNSTSYVDRSFFLTINDSASQVVAGYLLKTTDGQLVRMHAIDQANNPISSVLFTVSKLFGSTYLPVLQGNTDATGTTPGYLDPLVQYRFTYSHSSYGTFIEDLTPSNPDIYFVLSTSGNATINTTTSGVVWFLSPAGPWVEYNSTVIFNFTVFDNASSLMEWGIKILRSDNQSVYNQTVFYSAPGGVALVGVDTLAFPTFYVQVFYKKVGFDYYNFSQFFMVFNITSGSTQSVYGALLNGSNGSIPTVLQARGVPSWLLGYIILFIATLVTVLLVPRGFMGGAFVLLTILVVFMQLGWFSYTIWTFLAIIVFTLWVLRGRL